MTHPSLTNFKVYPLGFSAFEKSTIETFFRLAARRAPFWTVTSRVEEASVLLLSAATRQDVDTLAGRMRAGQQAVIVGSSDFGSGWPSVPRPLKLTALLSSLSVYVQDGAPQAMQLVPATGSPAPLATSVTTLTSAPVLATTVAPTTVAPTIAAPTIETPTIETATGPLFAPVSAPVSAPVFAPASVKVPAPVQASAVVARPAEKPVQFSTSGFGAQAIQRSSEVSAVIAARNVRIVDDSDVALKFMQSRLRHFGYESKLARSGEEALAMTEKRSGAHV